MGTLINCLYSCLSWSLSGVSGSVSAPCVLYILAFHDTNKAHFFQFIDLKGKYKDKGRTSIIFEGKHPDISFSPVDNNLNISKNFAFKIYLKPRI